MKKLLLFLMVFLITGCGLGYVKKPVVDFSEIATDASLAHQEQTIEARNYLIRHNIITIDVSAKIKKQIDDFKIQWGKTIDATADYLVGTINLYSLKLEFRRLKSLQEKLSTTMSVYYNVLGGTDAAN